MVSIRWRKRCLHLQFARLPGLDTWKHVHLIALAVETTMETTWPERPGYCPNLLAPTPRTRIPIRRLLRGGTSPEEGRVMLFWISAGGLRPLQSRTARRCGASLSAVFSPTRRSGSVARAPCVLEFGAADGPLIHPLRHSQDAGCRQGSRRWKRRLSSQSRPRGFFSASGVVRPSSAQPYRTTWLARGRVSQRKQRSDRRWPSGGFLISA